MSNTNFKVGDNVWVNPWLDIIVPAKIKALHIGESDGPDFCTVRIDGGFFHGEVRCLLSKTYASKEDVQQAFEDIKNKYRDEITDIKSLVLFCIKHCVSHAEEYTDYDAREVAIEKAAEFGIDISELN